MRSLNWGHRCCWCYFILFLPIPNLVPLLTHMSHMSIITRLHTDPRFTVPAVKGTSVNSALLSNHENACNLALDFKLLAFELQSLSMLTENPSPFYSAYLALGQRSSRTTTNTTNHVAPMTLRLYDFSFPGQLRRFLLGQPLTQSKWSVSRTVGLHKLRKLLLAQFCCSWGESRSASIALKSYLQRNQWAVIHVNYMKQH